jgi:hypothetical protein
MMNYQTLRRLARESRGTMAIETAIIAPVLLVMSLGAFEGSRMVARQSELQSAAAEAGAIIMAKSPTTQAEIDTIEDVIEASSGLPDAKVTLSLRYRCGTDADYVDDSTTCPDEVSSFIRIQMNDTYVPQFSGFGLGDSFDYNIDRLVQVS